MAARRSIGVYQPRTRRSAMADAMAEARLALARFCAHADAEGRRTAAVLPVRSAALIGAGELQFGRCQPRQRHRRGPRPIFWAGFGAIAADLLLQTFGIAALAALAPPGGVGRARADGQESAPRHVAGHRLAHGRGAGRRRPGRFPGAACAAGRRRRADRHRGRRTVATMSATVYGHDPGWRSPCR